MVELSTSPFYNRNMIITRTSMTSGITRSLDLPVTEAQLATYEGGALLQNAFPNLTPGEREFIKTGITQSEWVDIYGEDEE
jgi:hypothetical protein